MHRPALMKSTEYFDMLTRARTRRVRHCAFAAGTVFGFLAGLATWALWYAMQHPATWEVR